MIYPTADELKIMADELVKASVGYVVEPTEENLKKATFARTTMHAGIVLVIKALEEAQKK